jgi:hypothetical protein
MSAIFRESIGRFGGEKFFKLKLIFLWVFYEIVFYFGLIFHEQLFRYILSISVGVL